MGGSQRWLPSNAPLFPYTPLKPLLRLVTSSCRPLPHPHPHPRSTNIIIKPGIFGVRLCTTVAALPHICCQCPRFCYQLVLLRSFVRLVSFRFVSFTVSVVQRWLHNLTHVTGWSSLVQVNTCNVTYCCFFLYSFSL